MPNMTEGWAIVIAAVISVAGIILTQFFNWLHRKANFQDHLSLETFQKRMAVYEDVISALSMMITTQELPPDISARDVRLKISNYAHTLDSLATRLSLFGSPTSIKVFYSIKPPIFDILDVNIDVEDVTYAPHIRAALINTIKNALSEFTEAARIETSVNIVDKFLLKSGPGIKMFIKQNKSKKNAWKSNRHKSKRDY